MGWVAATSLVQQEILSVPHHQWPECCYNKTKIPVKDSSFINLWFCGICHNSNVPPSVWPGLTLAQATQLHDTSAFSPELERWHLHCLSVQRWVGTPSSSHPAKYQRRTEIQKACKWVCETRGGTAKESGPMGLGYKEIVSALPCNEINFPARPFTASSSLMQFPIPTHWGGVQLVQWQR